MDAQKAARSPKGRYGVAMEAESLQLFELREGRRSEPLARAKWSAHGVVVVGVMELQPRAWPDRSAYMEEAVYQDDLHL